MNPSVTEIPDISNGHSRPILAVFDFDGTLTLLDSFLPFLREASGAKKFWSGLVRHLPSLLLMQLGLRQNWQIKEKFIDFFLAGKSEGFLHRTAEKFANGRLQTLMNQRAIDRLLWHRSEKHRIIILTASPENYVTLWASKANVSEVLGTRLEMSDGNVTGRIAGKNCHGAEKVRRLTEHIGNLNDFEIYAYGDSKSDLDLLKLVQHPFYRPFRHDPLLLEICAKLKGWSGLI